MITQPFIRQTYSLDLRDLDPSDLLFPFLQVIISVDTTGNVTGAALLSVYNFINYRILGIDFH